MSRFTVLEKSLWRLGRRKDLCSLEAERAIIQAKSNEVNRQWQKATAVQQGREREPSIYLGSKVRLLGDGDKWGRV